ncbi:MAG: transposase [bacterium]
MAHSYISIYIHYIFSTKNRQKIIKPELEDQLWPYMGGIARENKMKALAIGGMEDHAHVFCPFLQNCRYQKPFNWLIDNTVNYIKNQKQHHKKQTFQEEYLAILKKHGIKYDEQYPWG